MSSGCGFSPTFRFVSGDGVDPRPTLASCSMAFFGVSTRVLLGVISLPSLALGRPSTTIFLSGGMGVTSNTSNRISSRSFTNCRSWIPSYGALTEPAFVPPALLRAGEKKERKEEPEDHALGRARGGYGTKAHLVVDGQGIPLHVEFTPAQTHEVKAAPQVLDPEKLPLRYLGEPLALAGDKGYSSKAFRALLLSDGIAPVIPQRANEKLLSDESFPTELYRQRNVVERCVGWLKECRRIATRYEKLMVSFRAMFDLAFLRQYLKRLSGAPV
jgi:transposase